jgi:hypothetical protein
MAYAGSVSSKSLYFYLAPFILIPCVFLGSACFFLPSRWVVVRSENKYLINLAWGATLHNVNCQIVIYGDSTAMVGIDPALIRQRTGLSACNIAEYEGMTIFNGTMVLDRYLSQNQRPKFLIFLYSPEDFDPSSQRHVVGLYEAMTWRVGQPNRLINLATLLRRPDEFFYWAGLGWRLTLERVAKRPASNDILQFRTAHKGQYPVDAPTATECETMVRPLSIPDREWIAGLRKYNRDGTTVLVDSTPMAPCDPKLSYFQQTLSALVDNRFQTIPITAFTTDGRMHANATGSALLSNMVADQVLQRMSIDSTGRKP